MYVIILLMCLSIIRGDAEVTATTTNIETETNVDYAVTTVTSSPTTIRIVGELRGLAHGVSSGKIAIIDNRTFHIPNFHFDGKAPEAYFIVGTGYTVSENGTLVPLDPASQTPLSEYSGQDIELTLPQDLSINEIDWLAVWCVKHQQNLGYIFLNKKLSPYPPQTFGIKNEVTSGPIVLVDKKTLFIPDLEYRGDHTNVHFWVGNGSEPNSEGVPIPDENGSLDSLHPYQGQNTYLNLPDGVSTDNIEYFGVWSVDEQLNLGHVMLKGIEDVPEAIGVLSAPSNKTLMRVPKCCPFSSIITTLGCEERPAFEFAPDFNVYQHNETHFNNVSLSLDTIIFEPYNYMLQCESGKYALDDKLEQFALLLNGSLLVKSKTISGILSQNHFCMDTVDDGSDKMKIFVCVPEYKIQQAMFFTYVTLTIISTFCFVGTFFLYCFWLRIEDIHRKCFTGYVFAMSVTFLCLMTVQVARVEGGGCEVLGFVFQFSLIASFTMLAILCFDIWIIVRNIDEDIQKRKRARWYLGVGLGVPILSLIISLARNLTPDVPNSFFKPQYQKNACYFEAESQRSFYFYFPITVSIIVSVVFLVMTKLKIVYNDREHQFHYYWSTKGKLYKFMWRKHFIVFGVALLWFIEVLIEMNYAPTSIFISIDVVEASQGIIVLLLFVANTETRSQIKGRYKARKKKIENRTNSYEEDRILKTSQMLHLMEVTQL